MSREEVSTPRQETSDSERGPAFHAGALPSNADSHRHSEEPGSPFASAPALTEDAMLALLERRDLPTETIEAFGKIPAAIKSRKVCSAITTHPHAPRHLALRFMRQSYSFDLMQFALNPGVAADLKRFADDVLIARLDSITLGERLTLSRRGSSAIAAALLLDKETRVFQVALDNGRLTEAAIVRALTRPTSAAFVEAVCRHAKWPLRREVQIALLRNPHTPLARAVEFARFLPAPVLRDVLHVSRLPEKIKEHLRQEMKARK